MHTDKGLVPLEQIKVGDMILSKHESGEGKQAYKRVVNTFKSSGKKAVRHVAISINYKKDGKLYIYFVRQIIHFG